MAAFATLRRGDFLYASVLFANGGNDNHHPRATVPHLTALLRPDRKSKYQIPPESSKDQVTIMACLRQGIRTLQRLEMEMKREWEGESQKLKKAAEEKSVGPHRSKHRAAPGKPRSTPTPKKSSQYVKSGPASTPTPTKRSRYIKQEPSDEYATQDGYAIPQNGIAFGGTYDIMCPTASSVF
ncbi:hypothetical protein BCR34DRAFT_584578 [Clohesyomyces aquaticus]|uniref:Uncharacterized protein n=1 Tax=Clohesyomyces aquaticus TaxID=1231657 RepID=A0A1Y2A142_9PLEO|nr:hypothetical protein BCR34DRAFT_584578 [Clohesyomyces aquaticus]